MENARELFTTLLEPFFRGEQCYKVQQVGKKLVENRFSITLLNTNLDIHWQISETKNVGSHELLKRLNTEWLAPHANANQVIPEAYY